MAELAALERAVAQTAESLATTLHQLFEAAAGEVQDWLESALGRPLPADWETQFDELLARLTSEYGVTVDAQSIAATKRVLVRQIEPDESPQSLARRSAQQIAALSAQSPKRPAYGTADWIIQRYKSENPFAKGTPQHRAYVTKLVRDAEDTEDEVRALAHSEGIHYANAYRLFVARNAAAAAEGQQWEPVPDTSAHFQWKAKQQRDRLERYRESFGDDYLSQVQANLGLLFMPAQAGVGEFNIDNIARAVGPFAYLGQSRTDSTRGPNFKPFRVGQPSSERNELVLDMVPAGYLDKAKQHFRFQPKVPLADATYGPNIGRTGFRTSADLANAVFEHYQKFYDHADAIAQARIADGRLPNNPLVVGRWMDKYARSQLKRWVVNEGLTEGATNTIQINRWLRDPMGTGRYRIPDVRIPSAGVICDGSIESKDASTPQVIEFVKFSGGNSVLIIRPTRLGGSYVIVP